MLENPTTDTPVLENPIPENPTPENPTQINKDRRNKEILIKDLSTIRSHPIQSAHPLSTAPAIPDTERKMGRDGEGNGSPDMDTIRAYEETIKGGIEYGYLCRDPQMDREQLDEIVSLILETVCSRRQTIRIAGDDYPAALVRAKFMKLDSGHIRYVMGCMKQNTTRIRNIKQYLLAALFNAPSTIGNYYASLANHDLYGSG
jgi:hypothetical protein